MFLADSHVHSNCSSDGRNSKIDMARAAQRAGVDCLCFTDHCDLDAHATGEADPNCFKCWPRMLETHHEVLAACKDGPEVLLGLELGEAGHNTALAMEIASQPELDFVLGSLHNLRGIMDFYDLRYEGEDHCKRLFELYLDELIEMAPLSCYDVMSHVGYPRRYMFRAGIQIPFGLDEYGDRLRVLFEALIQNGKGIELNCSGFRKKFLNEPFPPVEVLHFYRQLGGEIITLGSDAHMVRDAGAGLREGAGLLRDAGFKYYCVFRRRKPEFIPLD